MILQEQTATEALAQTVRFVHLTEEAGVEEVIVLSFYSKIESKVKGCCLLADAMSTT